MVQISLPRLDPPTNYKDLSDPVVLFLAEIVDQFNEAMTQLDGLIEAKGIDIGGGGAGPITVAVVGLTTTGSVNAALISSTNPATISTVTPKLNSFDITFSGDPGASAIIVYQAYTLQQP